MLERAAARIHAGGLVAFPTETVYGLGADATSPQAVAAVFALKGRPSHNPLIIHVTGEDMAQRYAARWPARARALARAFWPGPLSIIVPRGPLIPDAVAAGGPTIAVRAPDHPLALALLFAVGRPLVGPSANPSGGVSPTTAAHVTGHWSDQQVMVLDGGACATGIESTVVFAAADDQPVRILRPGVIGPAALSAALGEPVLLPTHAPAANAPEPLASPGLLASHYAPAAPALLFTDATWPDVLARAQAGGASSPAVLLTHRPRTAPGLRILTLPADAPAYAAALYSALRQADAARPAFIAIDTPPDPADASLSPEHAAIWLAVADRLARATAPR